MRLLGNLDRLETGILFDLPDQRTLWGNWVGKIGPRMEDFMVSDYNKFFTELAIREGRKSSVPPATRLDDFAIRHEDPVELLLWIFRKYVDDLATERCIWCWNEFTNYTYALWQLYGNRGVAIRSTVGEVKNALIKAGVERGIVAPIAYIDYGKVSDTLTNEENIFWPYLLKSVAYDYEKEIRFVVAARREIVRDKGGVLVTFDEVDFFKKETFPYFQREERSIVDTIISHHLNKTPEERFPRSSDSYWTEIYSPYGGTPFTKQDRGLFSDMS
jgi:hypothetical protein